MAKRAPLQLDALKPAAEPARPLPTPRTPAAAAPEPTSSVFARVPWSLAERLRDLARQRSREERRRVTVNDLMVEAIRKLLD